MIWKAEQKWRARRIVGTFFVAIWFVLFLKTIQCSVSLETIMQYHDKIECAKTPGIRFQGVWYVCTVTLPVSGWMNRMGLFFCSA